MEPLNFLFDLLQVDLRLTVLLVLVLVPGRRKESALLEKSLEACRQPLVPSGHRAGSVHDLAHLASHLFHHSGQPVQSFQEWPRVKPGLFPRWPRYFDDIVVVIGNLCRCLLLLALLASSW